MRLIPDPPGKTVGGEVIFDGKDLLKLPEEEMRKIRGNKIGMIFQEPMTSLNPVFYHWQSDRGIYFAPPKSVQKRLLRKKLSRC